MSHFVSRVLVTVVGVPVVLYFVYLGGWWLFGLAAFAALVALHELYVMARIAAAAGAGRLRRRARDAARRRSSAAPEWMLGGFMLTLVLAFLLYGIAETRQPATVTMSTTVMGVGLDRARARASAPAPGRPRARPTRRLHRPARRLRRRHRRVPVGRLLGRHKLAPSLSPGKTWEGFVAGTLAAIAVAFFALYEQDFLSIPESIVLGAAIALAGAAGDLFESALKRDLQVKDSGQLLGGHGGMLDRIDSLLFASVAAFYVVHSPGVGHTVTVKRIALLGATGSIGRQAIEVVERNPELELCALASGSSDLTALAAEHGVAHTQVGGDVTELLEAAEPDVVLNAVVGFAGVGATLWALERGVTLALANKESLVAAGELALAAKERGGGLLLPVDSEHSALFQCLEGRDPGFGRLARADRLGRAVPRPQPRRARRA